MKRLAYFRSLAARFFYRSQTENDLEEELRSHIKLRADDLERVGLTRAEVERRRGSSSEAMSGSKKNAAKRSLEISSTF